MRRLGDRLEAAATFNEPWCVAWLSHFLGHHAPGVRDIRAAARAMHHILLAHGKATRTMRDLGMDNLGVVLNFEYAAPADDSADSQAAARMYDGIYNRFFLGGVFKQAYPEDVLVGLEPHLPANYQDDFPVIATPVDWLGVNYYTRTLLKQDDSGLFPHYEAVEGPLPKTTMGWEVYPDGLYHFLTWVHREYAPDLPIYVTENGLSANDVLVNGKVSDPQRVAFIEQHLQAVLRAIKDGVPVKGYFIWSLLDNYEWSLGYDKRFGLVYVDFETLERTPKESWYAVREMLVGA